MPRTRKRPDRALQHPVRKTLRERLEEANAPVALEDLAQAVGLAIDKARYHVRVLAAYGLAELDDDENCTQPA